MLRRSVRKSDRQGAIVPLTALLMIMLLAMVAFAVDLGYLAVARSEAQNAADAAALAGMSKLAEQYKRAPVVDGAPVQTAAHLARARDEVKEFARRNLVGGQQADVQDADIEIGYLADPYDHSSDVLETTGWPERPYNAVRVTVLRDENHAGGSVTLFFGRVLGTSQADVKATAVAAFAMGRMTPRGNHDGYRGGLLPFTYQVDEWNALLAADSPGPVNVNGVTLDFTDNYTVSTDSTDADGVEGGDDGELETKLYPNRTTSGNFGTINFSQSKVGNSTSELRDLIVDGPDEADFPDLPEITQASSSNPVGVNGDPGLSSGMESAVEAIIGQPQILPLYSTVSGTGNNTQYQLVGFVPVTITAVRLSGSGNSYITIQPRVISHRTSVDGDNAIDFDLTPNGNPDPLFMGPRGLVR
jgi:hypothetical protein